MQNTDTLTGLQNTVFLTASRLSRWIGLPEDKLDTAPTNTRHKAGGFLWDKSVDGNWYNMGKADLGVANVNTVNNPLDVQEGGDHYRKYKIQPVEYINANNLSFLAGNIVKYITRYRDKGGRQDIEKIKHYCDLILEFEYKDT